MGVNRGIPVELEVRCIEADGSEGEGDGVREVDGDELAVTLELVEAGSEVDASGRLAQSRVIAENSAVLDREPLGVVGDGAGPVWRGALDLSRVFPVVWTMRDARVMYVQARWDGRRVGAPLVLEPMRPPSRVEDGLTRRVMALVRSAAGLTESGVRTPVDESMSAIRRVLLLPQLTLRDLLGTPEVKPTPALSPVSGVRVYVRRDVVMRTSLGEMRFRLRPDAAGETAYRFAEASEDGWYDGSTFHRVVAEDAQGRPFIVQGGDPTGTGLGGLGYALDFEVSPLEHAFGVLSMARRDGEPNSASGQFLVCLSRAGCAGLDGRFVAFGELVEGAATLRAIAAVPVRRRDGVGALDEPIEPVVIESVDVVDAAPIGTRSRVEARPVSRERLGADR